VIWAKKEKEKEKKSHFNNISTWYLPLKAPSLEDRGQINNIEKLKKEIIMLK
jgi:hypothetical protein